MPNRVASPLSALALLVSCAILVSAQDQPAPSATLELIHPAGATATVDGVAVGDKRTVPVGDLKPIETRRVTVAVKFADGATDERQVDVTAGQRISVPVPH